MNIGDKVSGNVVTLFAAVTNSDLQEGRGQKVYKTYHLKESDAVIATSGIGVMGSDGEVEPIKALDLRNGEYVILPEETVRVSEDTEAKAKLREKAMGKLSKAEKAALFEK